MLNKKALAGARMASAAPTDADFEYVTMLLHGDGTNGAQNNTFIDGSTNNFTVTRNGNVTQGSLNPFGDRWSNYFDGSGDWLEIVDNAALELGSGDFTIEAWIYLNALPSNLSGAAIVNKWNASNYSYLAAVYNNNSAMQLFFGYSTNGTSTTNITANAAIAVGRWYHVAYVRNGSSFKMFLSGSEVTSSATISGSLFDGTQSVNIGRSGDNFNFLNGYISNLRVVKGTAVYTANFTPPTAPLTAITNTSLLTCQSSRFRDASSNNFRITRNGDVSVRPFNPFSPSAAYSTSVNGGSSYYGTTDSYITLPDNANLRLGNNNFTFEMWFYKISDPGAAGNIVAWNTKNDNSAYAALRVQLNSSGAIDLIVSETGTSWQINTSSSVVYTNRAWNHIAMVRNGGTITVYINGTSVVSGSLSSATASLFAGTVNNINELFYNTNTWSMIGYISNARLVIGTAVYTANFTPPTAPLTAITNTSLLLNFTNGGIIDNAADNVLETVGNAQISTSVKKFGTGSLAFDGSGDTLTIPASPDIEFGGGNFTFEFWFLSNVTSPSGGEFWLPANNASGFRRLAIYLDTSRLTVAWFGTILIQSSSLTWAANTWYHIAVVRNGNTWTAYRDGTSVGSTTNSNALDVASGYVIGGNNLNGYIDDLRITKGVARYTANFTPPTAAFPDL